MDEQKTVTKYPKFCTSVESILLDFSSLYISHAHYLLSRKYFEHRTWWFMAQTCKVISLMPTKHILLIKKNIIQNTQVI